MTQQDDEALSRLYQTLDKPEPTETVDEFVMASARTEIAKSSWRPLVVAATLMLGIGLTAMISNEPVIETVSVPKEQPTTAQVQAQGFSLAAESETRPTARAVEGDIPFPTPKPPAGSLNTTVDTTPTVEQTPDPMMQHSGSDPYHDFRPEDWLTQIGSLWENGDFAQARRSFVEFRRRYPDYLFPTDFPVSEASLLIDTGAQ